MDPLRSLAAVIARYHARLDAMHERAVEIDGLDEQRRYYLQHYLQFQVHNPQHPHRYRRHGRADVGWQGIDGHKQ